MGPIGVRLSPDGYQKILPLCSLFIVITAVTRLTAGTSYSVIAADVMYLAINVYVVVVAADAAVVVLLWSSLSSL